MQLVVMCKLFSYDVICKQSTSHISQTKGRHTCYKDEFRLMLGPMNCIWVTGRWRLARKRNKKNKKQSKAYQVRQQKLRIYYLWSDHCCLKFTLLDIVP